MRWAGDVPPKFTARSIIPGKPGRKAFRSSPLSLDQYSVSFWSVRGEERSVAINYQAEDEESHPFLVLTTTDPVLVPGTGEVAVGDSVLITVTIDTTKFGVSLEPNGLQFGTPAQLQIFYGGASGDLTGDGVADSVDTYVEEQLLGMWYREGESPWSAISSSHSIENKSFSAELPHFSEYILSFLVEFLDWAVSW